MNVLMIYPETANNVQIVKFPPYGMACLVAYIKKYNKNVRVSVHGYRAQQIRQTVRKEDFESYDVVGFGFTTPNYAWVYEKTKAIKKLLPNIVIIHGGIHPTIDPKASLENSADIVVQGEGEETLSHVLHNIEIYGNKYYNELHSIEGISYRIDNEFFSNPNRALIHCLDDIPWPDWSVFDFDSYSSKDFTLPVMGSRGCAFACNFCCSPIMWKRRVRYRSPQSIVDEIKHNTQKFGVRRYRFLDDDFLSNREFVIELCQLMIQQCIGIQYIIFARSDSVNRNQDMLGLLRDSGCVEAEIGVENTSPEILTKMDKKITMVDVELTVKLLKEYGISIFYLLIFCYPGETISSIRSMNQFINYLRGTEGALVYGQYLVPYPGTNLYATCRNDGILIETDFTHFISTDIVFLPFSMLNEHPIRNQQPTEEAINSMVVSYVKATRQLGLAKTKEMIMQLLCLSDGSRSVQDIINIFIHDKGFDEKFASKFVYRFINYLSQLNMVINNQ